MKDLSQEEIISSLKDPYLGGLFSTILFLEDISVIQQKSAEKDKAYFTQLLRSKLLPDSIKDTPGTF